MSINERFFKDVVKTITGTENDILAKKVYEQWKQNKFILDDDKMFDLLKVNGYRIVHNELYGNKKEALVKMPTVNDKLEAYRVLKDYFENAFKSRDRFFEENNIEPIYSDIISKLIDGCRVELEKCDYKERYDVNIINNTTGEKVYGLYQYLNNIVLTNDEREQFYKMLKWYIFNVPYSEMNPTEMECSFVDDVLAKYYMFQKNNKKQYDNLIDLIVLSDNSRPFETPYYPSARICWGDNRWTEYRDHFSENKYNKNCFFSYSSDGMKISESVPRFNIEDLYINVNSEDAKIIAATESIFSPSVKFYNLLSKQYEDYSIINSLAPVSLLINNMGYNDILNKISITDMDQIRNLIIYLRSQKKYDLNLIEKLCRETVDKFVDEVQVISKDLEKYKRELTLKLIMDYVINDGEYDYLFNIRDDRNTKPEHFEFNTISGYVKSVVFLNINKDKSSYKRFLGEKKELVNLDNTNKIRL